VKCPCEKCIKLAICKSNKKLVICEDMYQYLIKGSLIDYSKLVSFYNKPFEGLLKSHSNQWLYLRRIREHPSITNPKPNLKYNRLYVVWYHFDFIVTGILMTGITIWRKLKR
jgi:hypothetical protein